jgi:hypothetical protein
MPLFKQYLDLKYPGNAWQTKDPDELFNAFYDFLGDPANEAAADAFAEKEKAIYEVYKKNVENEVKKAKAKLTGLARAPVPQQAIQKANHIRLLIVPIDDWGDKIIMPGRIYAAEKQRAQALAEEEKIFNGEWETDIDNTIPAPAAFPCNAYNNKHFGVDKSAAQYLGRFKDYKLVKALEEKARSALLMEACIFRFNEEVGHDGTKGSNSPMTKCIRVDNAGEAGQHSHPIPEEGVGSHDAYVKDNIIKSHNENDREDLLDIAKYLTIIGATKGEYKFSNNELNKLTGKKFNFFCKFWNSKT